MTSSKFFRGKVRRVEYNDIGWRTLLSSKVVHSFCIGRKLNSKSRSLGGILASTRYKVILSLLTRMVLIDEIFDQQRVIITSPKPCTSTIPVHLPFCHLASCGTLTSIPHALGPKGPEISAYFGDTGSSPWDTYFITTFTCHLRLD